MIIGGIGVDKAARSHSTEARNTATGTIIIIMGITLNELMREQEIGILIRRANQQVIPTNKTIIATRAIVSRADPIIITVGATRVIEMAMQITRHHPPMLAMAIIETCGRT